LRVRFSRPPAHGTRRGGGPGRKLTGLATRTHQSPEVDQGGHDDDDIHNEDFTMNADGSSAVQLNTPTPFAFNGFPSWAEGHSMASRG